MANDPLDLRHLPQPEPPGALWQAISDTLDARRPVPARKRRPPAWTIALAASLTAIAVCVAVLRGLPDPAAPDQDGSARLAQLRSVSAVLEGRLEEHRFGVVNAAAADSLARLEQELAWLDLQIAASPDDPALWTERVSLLDQMNKQYRRSDWRAELQLASY